MRNASYCNKTRQDKTRMRTPFRPVCSNLLAQARSQIKPAWVTRYSALHQGQLSATLACLQGLACNPLGRHIKYSSLIQLLTMHSCALLCWQPPVPCLPSQQWICAARRAQVQQLCRALSLQKELAGFHQLHQAGTPLC